MHSGVVYKYTKIFGDQNKLNAALAKAGISSKHSSKLFPAWEPGSLKWMNFIGKDAVASVRMGHPADLYPLVKLESHFSDMQQLVVLVSANGFGIDIDAIVSDLIETRPLMKKIWERQELSSDEMNLVKNYLTEVVLSSSPQRIVASKFMINYLTIAAANHQEWEEALAKLNDVANGKTRSRQLVPQSAEAQMKFLKQFLQLQVIGQRCVNLF